MRPAVWFRAAAGSRGTADEEGGRVRRVYTRRSRPLITGDRVLVLLMGALAILSLVCFLKWAR
jgi:hypothetical protein